MSFRRLTHPPPTPPAALPGALSLPSAARRRPRFYYWEAVQMMQTLGLVAAEVFGRVLAVYQQALLQILLLTFMTAVTAGLRPNK